MEGFCQNLSFCTSGDNREELGKTFLASNFITILQINQWVSSYD